MGYLKQLKGLQCSHFGGERPGGPFSKVPIINGPGKPSPFILKIKVSKVLHLA